MDVLNRTTKAYRTSVNTPDFPVADWIHQPDMSAVVGFQSKYWIITGDVVTLMDQSARDAVDAAEAAQRILDERQGATEGADAADADGIRTRALVEVLVTIANYNAARLIETRTMVQALANAITNANNLSQLQSAVAAIDTTGSTIDDQRTRAGLVTLFKSIINAGDVDNG